MSRTMYDENDIDHWITVRGAKIPVLKDGTLGVGTKNDSEADNKQLNLNTESGMAQKMFGKKYSELSESQKDEVTNAVMRNKKPASQNSRYDTSKSNTTKKQPTALEAFKENSRQMMDAMKEATKQGALEFEYTDMTGKTFHRWWDGAKFVDRKVSQSMERRYGKRSGIFKSSFRKPDDWE